MMAARIVIAATLVVGLAGTVAVVVARNPDESFIQAQRRQAPLSSAEVERVVRTAPNPAAPRLDDGIQADCRRAGKGELGNPWSCVVRYRSGRRVRFGVVVGSDGSYRGDPAGSPGVVTGCCVRVGG